MKSVRIRSFSDPRFPAFGLNMYVFLFSPNSGKCGPEELRIRTLFTQCNFDAVSASNLNAIRKRNINRLFISQLNINFLRNKLESLVYQVTENIDILIVLETKIDASFPMGQLLMDGYGPPFRLDRDNNGESIMLFVSYFDVP